MNSKRIYKRLLNKKGLEVFYRKDENTTYTIRLNFENNLFIIHSYSLDGDDVFDEANYKDECTIRYNDFGEFMQELENKFPGIKVTI